MLTARAPRRRVRGPVTATIALALALAGCSAGEPAEGDATVAVDTARSIDLGSGWDWQPQPGPLQLGVTHTQDSLDSWDPAPARTAGRGILSADAAVWQNQHLMGFGADNPEAVPGQYDWSSLDARMQLIEDTGGRTVLTLCCAPDWMKGDNSGTTDWSTLEDAPLAAHFDDFATLAAAAVTRYPQVERVLVWNELKGFYHADQNRWDYEGYTELYNKVYTAVKAARPDVAVGGPYAIMTSVEAGTHDASALSGPWGSVDQRALDIVDYWLANNVGADFLALDAGTAVKGGSVTSPLDVGARKFADVTAWVQQRSALPVWWAEFYPDVPKGIRGGGDSATSAAATLASVGAFARSGVATALLWGPQASSLTYSALWTDATKADGGRATRLTPAWQWLVPRLAAGSVEIGHSTTQPLLAFKADDGAVIVNLSDGPVPVPGHPSLPAWGVVVRDNGA